MSWFDFLKIHKTVNSSEEVVREGEQETKSIYISFDKDSLVVVGGNKSRVAHGEFDWAEQIDLSRYATTPDLGKEVALVTLAINDLKHRLEGGGDISVSLPMNSVFTKYITIPKSNLPEQLLQAEMKKYVPLPFEEMLFASNRVKEVDNQVSYFCVVIHKPLFDTYTALFKNYGIQPYFELGCFTLARLVPDGMSLLMYVGLTESYALLVYDRVVIDLAPIILTQHALAGAFAQEYGLSRGDASLLIDALVIHHTPKAQSSHMVQAFVKQHYIALARELVVVHDMFAANHQTKISQVYCSGVEVSILKEACTKEVGSELPLSQLLVAGEECDRYTHQIGLAKRT